jgi:hypothetical protein
MTKSFPIYFLGRDLCFHCMQTTRSFHRKYCMDSKFQKVCEDQLDWCAKPVKPVASISSKNALYQTHAHQISFLQSLYFDLTGQTSVADRSDWYVLYTFSLRKG